MKLVCESLEELNELSKRPIIRLTPTPEQREKYKNIFQTKNFMILANEINNAPFKAGKIDIPKFHKLLTDRGFTKSERELRKLLIEIAPIIGGLRSYLDLSKEERSDIKFMEKYNNGRVPIEEFDEMEISPEEATEPTDYVVRSMGGDTEPGYYRPNGRLTPHARNIMRAHYAFKHKHEVPNATLWGVYLGAVPATKGHIEKFGKSEYWTQNPEEFHGKEYDN